MLPAQPLACAKGGIGCEEKRVSWREEQQIAVREMDTCSPRVPPRVYANTGDYAGVLRGLRVGGGGVRRGYDMATQTPPITGDRGHTFDNHMHRVEVPRLELVPIAHSLRVDHDKTRGVVHRAHLETSR